MSQTNKKIIKDRNILNEEKIKIFDSLKLQIFSSFFKSQRIKFFANPNLKNSIKKKSKLRRKVYQNKIGIQERKNNIIRIITKKIK